MAFALLLRNNIADNKSDALASLPAAIFPPFTPATTSYDFLYQTFKPACPSLMGPDDAETLPTLLDHHLLRVNTLELAPNNSPVLKSPTKALQKKFESITFILSNSNKPNKRLKKIRTLVLQSLQRIYERNLIDKCKLDELLKWKEFKIFIATHAFIADQLGSENIPDKADGFYYVLSKTIWLDARNLFRYSSYTLEELLTHELRHALDAYYNLENGINLIEYNKQTFPLAINFGFNKNVASSEEADKVRDKKDQTRVLKWIALDLQRLDQIGWTLKLDPQLSSSDATLLKATFLAYIKQYDYQPMYISTVVKKSELQMLIELAKKNKFAFKEGYYYKRTSTSDIFQIAPNRYVEEIYPDSSSVRLVEMDVTQIKDMPEQDRLIALGKNLLTNLFELMDHIQRSLPHQTVAYEFGAFFEQTLAPYSHKLDKDRPSLAEWLLPNFSKHQQQRTTKAFQHCLKSSNTLFAQTLQRVEMTKDPTIKAVQTPVGVKI